MKLFRLLGVALTALALSLPLAAQAQQAGQPDEVAQLASLVNLTDDQQKEIRGLIQSTDAEVRKLQAEARSLQEKLQGEVKPGYSERNITRTAKKLGEVMGEITGKTVLLQAQVESVMTEEQRAELQKKMEEQQRQMQQRMQQMQQQQQQQQR
ncbi:Spy/CpxP family protein refolding chaperone [Alloalcanivorax xenomutans]|uniref:Spy/CpxP family protein refolding chaperone n=1 Tax=Alloalcanivorax xenomutans TaxID=1094342 RepID=UPI00292E7ACF|nr:Spy/CpxP family protein refolding chaperone [Alloalcanivorax xenomutans]WOA30000.1 Spy/CpxP family protein refolding chaperone [Alloalcanivorax xenomutans]